MEKFYFIKSSYKYYETVMVPVILTRWQCTHKMAVLGNLAKHGQEGLEVSAGDIYTHPAQECLVYCVAF